MSKPVPRATRLNVLAAHLLVLAVLLAPQPTSGVVVPRPPAVAPIGALSSKLECRLGAARAAR